MLTPDDLRKTDEADRMDDDQHAREPILQFFVFGHLRDDLKETSAQFGNLAEYVAANLPRNPERTVALRKLLEAKDAAVRAKLYA